MENPKEPKSEAEKLVEYKKIVEEANGKGVPFSEQYEDFVENIKNNYGKELDNVALWHVLAGSSLKEGHSMTHFDLPNGELEHFIRDVLPTLESGF